MNKVMPILNETECSLLLSGLQRPFDEGLRKLIGIRNHLIALLMLDAGLRVGEVVSLKVNQLWFAGEPVGGIAVATEKKKQKTIRTIPVTERLRTAILDYATSPDTFAGHAGCCYVFRRRGAEAYITPRQVERFIRKAALETLRRPVHPHVLRHTFATRLMTKCSIRVVQQLLGHASITSTQVYTHPNSQDLQTAIDSLNGSQDPASRKEPKP